MAPTVEHKRDILGHLKKRIENDYTGTDTVQVCDFTRPGITIQNGQTLKVLACNNHRSFEVYAQGDCGLRLLHRGFRLTSTGDQEGENSTYSILCTDDNARIIKINIAAGDVEVF